jgi:hypothetical protein
MPRKPAHLELVGGIGLRQRIWDRIRGHAAKGQMFDLPDLLFGDELDSIDTAREYITGLFHAGYLDLHQAAVTTGPASRRRPKRYSLARDVGADAPRVRRDGTPVTQGLAQEQMWRVLRTLRGDTNGRELAFHASTQDVPVAEVAARDYLRHLHFAGYLTLVKPGRGLGSGGIQARYRLLPDHNTGPRPPMVCRTKAVYDPNLNQMMWVAPVTEEEVIYGR